MYNINYLYNLNYISKRKEWLIMFCQKCGKKIADDAKFCPSCGESTNTSTNSQKSSSNLPTSSHKKKWTKKKIALVVIGILFILSVIDNLIWDDKNTSKPTTSQNQSNTSSEKKPSYKEWTVDVDGIGKIKGGISSDVGIAVAGVNTQQSIGNEFINEKAKGQFVVVDLVIYNNQKDAITVDGSSFKLIDNKNREFSTSNEGMTALQMSEGHADGFLSKINPGLTTRIRFVFDVPGDATGLQLKARGGFTGEAITLPLQVIPVNS